jgi:Ca-activated chloride channel homolog
MHCRSLLTFLLPALLFLAVPISGQVFTIPASQFGGLGLPEQLGLISSAEMTNDLWAITGAQTNRSLLDTPVGSVSKLDLKAPYRAKRAYDKGYAQLARKDLHGAVENLTSAIKIYPSFVAAHNALGAAYLGLQENDQAREQFKSAIALDDHLPNSYLNLGCAELALQHFPEAEQAIQKASAIAPLDLTLLTALAYSQLFAHDYGAVISTVKQIHSRKHQEATIAHYFAALAWASQGNLREARRELATLLQEDGKSPAALAAVQMSEQLKEDEENPAVARLALNSSYSQVMHTDPTGPVQLPDQFRGLMLASKENAQIADAESLSDCADCGSESSRSVSSDNPKGALPNPAPVEFEGSSGYLVRASADEVAIFFTASDHGRPITDLTAHNIRLRDGGMAPAGVTGFRNEHDLPLRLGLILDTSASVTSRFKFEQDAAARFVKQILTDPKDLGFVIGVSNSVLVVQDFTSEPKLLSNAVGQLAPAGGTAIWDAVAYAAEKLAGRAESQPVARVLVVISDGEDNSSSATLKDAVARAQSGDVAVYTVSTRDLLDEAVPSLVGEHALTTLSELTGGVAFSPGSLHRLNGSLLDLQKIIRSRYLISYKPARFQRNGEYRSVNITAEKDGRKLRLYSRKGYVAGTPGDHLPVDAKSHSF